MCIVVYKLHCHQFHTPLVFTFSSTNLHKMLRKLFSSISHNSGSTSILQPKTNGLLGRPNFSYFLLPSRPQSSPTRFTLFRLHHPDPFYNRHSDLLYSIPQLQTPFITLRQTPSTSLSNQTNFILLNIRWLLWRKGRTFLFWDTRPLLSPQIRATPFSLAQAMRRSQLRVHAPKRRCRKGKVAKETKLAISKEVSLPSGTELSSPLNYPGIFRAQRRKDWKVWCPLFILWI